MVVHEPDDEAKRESALTTAGRIVQSLVIAAILFLLLSVGAFFHLGGRVELAGPTTSEPPEPFYRDEYGNRMREVDYMEKAGYEQAKAGSLARHVNCLALDRKLQGGCHRYVTQHNIPPHVPQGNFASGKTTAECLREVDAYWQAVIEDMREQGADQAADWWATHEWSPERQQCNFYDRSLASRQRQLQPSESDAHD